MRNSSGNLRMVITMLEDASYTDQVSHLGFAGGLTLGHGWLDWPDLFAVPDAVSSVSSTNLCRTVTGPSRYLDDLRRSSMLPGMELRKITEVCDNDDCPAI